MINIQSQGQEWEVEKILQRGRFKNITHYLILWKGFSADQATWEPITNLQHCQQAIIDFEKGLKTVNKPATTEKKEKRRKINFDNVFKPPEVNNIDDIKIEGNNFSNQELEAIRKIPQKDPFQQLSKNSTQPDSLLNEILPSIKEGNDQTKKKDIKDNISVNYDLMIPLKQPVEEDVCQEGLSRKKVKLNQPMPIRQIPSKDKELSQNQNNNQYITPKEIEPIVRERHFFNDKIPSKKISSNAPSAIQKENPQLLKQVKSQNELLKIKEQKQPKAVVALEAVLAGCITKKNVKYYLPLSSDISRYKLCDNELQFQQKQCLMNILRKKSGEKRTKPAIKIVDISNNEDVLSAMSDLKLITISTSLEYLDLLIKIRYGWMAVGRTADSQFIMIDVNLIKQESWNSLKKYLNKD